MWRPCHKTLNNFSRCPAPLVAVALRQGAHDLKNQYNLLKAKLILLARSCASSGYKALGSLKSHILSM